LGYCIGGLNCVIEIIAFCSADWLTVLISVRYIACDWPTCFVLEMYISHMQRA